MAMKTRLNALPLLGILAACGQNNVGGENAASGPAMDADMNSADMGLDANTMDNDMSWDMNMANLADATADNATDATGPEPEIIPPPRPRRQQ